MICCFITSGIFEAFNSKAILFVLRLFFYFIFLTLGVVENILKAESDGSKMNAQF